MYDESGCSDARRLLAQAHAAVDSFGVAALVRDVDDDLLAGWHDLEALRRKLSFCEHRLIAEIETRGVAVDRGAKDTAALGADLLRITGADARQRVLAARLLGPQRRFGSGEEFAALFPQAAAAQAEGAVSAEHARVITKCIKMLPADIRETAHDDVEQLLVKEARDCDPDELIRVGQQVHAHLDPDGKPPRDAQHTRAFDVHERADGSSRVRGDLTAEATARLKTVLDAFTHPRNLGASLDVNAGAVDPLADPAHKDGRSATQRRHDAFLSMLKQLQSDTFTPTAGGLHTQLVITIDWQAWLTGRGLARTGHGRLISATDAIAWAGGNPRVIAVALDQLRGIAAYSCNQRIFTEQQRLAFIARDGGCSFAGCDAPPWYCEAHHIVPWAQGGTTSVDNGHLVCSRHHRHSKAEAGWQVRMIDGRPAWIPPPHVDPDQVPRFNTRHRPRDLKELLTCVHRE